MSGQQLRLTEQQRETEITKCLKTFHSSIDQLQILGVPTAGLYYLKEQFNAYGNGAMCEGSRENAASWELDPNFQVRENATCLIKLPLPAPDLAKCNYAYNKDFLKEYLPQFIGKKPGYTKPERRPEWYPIELWSTKKYITKGVNVHKQHQIMASMYRQFENIELVIPPPKKSKGKKIEVSDVSTQDEGVPSDTHGETAPSVFETQQLLPKRKKNEVSEVIIQAECVISDTQGKSAPQFLETQQFQQLTNVQGKDIYQLQPLLYPSTESMPSTSHNGIDYWIDTAMPMGPSVISVETDNSTLNEASSNSTDEDFLQNYPVYHPQTPTTPYQPPRTRSQETDFQQPETEKITQRGLNKLPKKFVGKRKN